MKKRSFQSSAHVPSVAIKTLGCRLNQYESDGIMSHFIESGRYRTVQSEESPDITVINTCTVTSQADSRNRNSFRRALRENPNGFVVFTGCYAQTDSESFSLPANAVIVPNEKKSSLFTIVDQILEKKILEKKALEKKKKLKEPQSKQEDSFSYCPPSSKDMKNTLIDKQGYSIRPVMENPFSYGKILPFGHTRAYLKIQDGCDRKCSYCKIPAARGKGVSRPSIDILDHVRFLEDQGIPEIILTGVNLGWYKERQNKLSFTGLIEKILLNLTNARLRLSSIEPCDVDHQLALLSTHPRFCDFLHVPLQSGSFRILKSMRRSYTPESFRKRIEAVRSVNPNFFLGTDLMTGFPSETEKDFVDTIRFCRDIGMAGIHPFRFSAREGTPAASYPESISIDTIRNRMQRLQGLRRELWESYAVSQIGKIQYGIVLEKNENDFSLAICGNSLQARIHRPLVKPKGQSLPRKGQLLKLRLGNPLSDSFHIQAEVIE